MTNPDSIRGTRLIAKACSLLQLFGKQQTEMGLTELAIQAGLHPTTAYRILQALVREGLLIQDAEGGKYRLGYTLIKLGELAKRSNDLIRIATPHVEKLAKLWGETTILDTINRNFEVVSVFAVQSTYRLGINLNYDKPLPAHCLAAGKVLLGSLSPQRLNNYLNQNFSSFTPQTITNADELRHSLEKVRESGYATNLEEHEMGFNAVGAPIRDASGKVVAAVSVGGPAYRLTPDQLPAVIASVVKTAELISMDLGYEKTLSMLD